MLLPHAQRDGDRAGSPYAPIRRLGSGTRAEQEINSLMLKCLLAPIRHRQFRQFPNHSQGAVEFLILEIKAASYHRRNTRGLSRE